MSHILLGQALTLEHVPEMRSAFRTEDFYPAPIGIRNAFDGPGNLGIETRPPATGMKLVPGSIESGIAPPAEIFPLYKKIIILARKRRLSRLSDYHRFFFWRKLVPGAHMLRVPKKERIRCMR